MEDKELEEHLKERRKIKVDFISVYNHEIQRVIGVDLQQLLVMLYYQGDEFAKRVIQEHC